MKRIYVIIGEREDSDQIDIFEGAYTSMARADDRCYELEQEQSTHIWYWREVILEEDEDDN